jgi:hypothetical protein
MGAMYTQCPPAAFLFERFELNSDKSVGERVGAPSRQCHKGMRRSPESALMFVVRFVVRFVILLVMRFVRRWMLRCVCRFGGVE